jgi:hypothetical protein
MNIYRNLENKKLYTIEHLILDIKHLNRNANAGIYATPYKFQGEEMVLKSKDKTECELFVSQNFVKIAES